MSLQTGYGILTILLSKPAENETTCIDSEAEEKGHPNDT